MTDFTKADPDNPAGMTAATGIPFEHSPGLKGFFATIPRMLTRPIITMTGQQEGRHAFKAFLFYLIINFLISVVMIIRYGPMLQIIYSASVPPVIAEFIGRWAGSPGALPAVIAFLQLTSGTVLLLLQTAVAHGVLSLLTGGGLRYTTTIKAYCYAVAPGAAGIVFLLLGWLFDRAEPLQPSILSGISGIFSIWCVVLPFFYFGSIHKAAWWKGVLAVLLSWLPYALWLLFEFKFH